MFLILEDDDFLTFPRLEDRTYSALTSDIGGFSRGLSTIVLEYVENDNVEVETSIWFHSLKLFSKLIFD